MGIGFTLDNGKNKKIRFDDLSSPATRTKRGANDKPDFDYTNFGLLFPQNSISEYVILMQQMKHEKALTESIHLHIHYIQSTVAQPIFTCEYRWYNNGSDVPVFTTINTCDEGGSKGIFPYTSGNKLQICAFPWIDPPENETVSSHFEAKVYRNDNDITGDVLVKYIDLHIPIDSDGSREEFIK